VEGVSIEKLGTDNYAQTSLGFFFTHASINDPDLNPLTLMKRAFLERENAFSY